MVGRTVIIASHAVEALAPLADQAIFLDAGRVVWQGDGSALMDSEHMAHLKTEKEQHPQEQKSEEPNLELLEKRRGSENPQDAQTFEIKEAPPKTPRQLIMDEARAKGNVDLRHWRELMGFNGGKVFWEIMTALLLGSSIMPIVERRVLE
jgi:ABC-type multidrug transport system ATPase subunit